MLRLQGERLADIVLTRPRPTPRRPSRPTPRCRRSACGPALPLRRDRPVGGGRHRPGDPARPVGGLRRPRAAARRPSSTSSSASSRPSRGDIQIGEASLRRSGGEAPPALIGTVMQDDTLFAGSIADNICFFDPAPDRAPHRGMRPAGPDPRRDRRAADGLQHPGRRHGHGAVRAARSSACSWPGRCTSSRAS